MANSDHVELEEVAINVDPIKSLLDLVEEGRIRGSQLQPSICMVPKIYRDQNPNCFDPQVVSIGPIHRGHENVQEHEGLKGAYMHDLLARLNFPREQILQRCYKQVSSYIDQIKSCYAWKDTYPQSDDNIAKMMVTDACFILEFIQKISESHTSLYSGNMFTGINILTDLILIENQIPFFVLRDIFNLTLSGIQQKDSTLITLLLNVLSRLNPFKAELQIDNHRDDFKHILEILHKSFWPQYSAIECDNIQPIYRCRSAVELDRAGLKFKPNPDGKWALVMEFESSALLGKPTLRMPILSIHDKTELVLRNLIAYEQSYPDVNRHYFTSFAVAMDMLVDGTEDVIKLVNSEVIVNDLGSNEIAANMINSIANETTFITFTYGKQWQQLDDYYKRNWPKNMAWLRRRHFSSPWSVTALVAGILLFALTVIQTIFTVIQTIFTIKSA